MVKVISLGAGVQSTTLLLMAARGEFGEDYPRVAVFADTQWEPKKVYDHLDWLEKEVEKYGIKIIRASKGNLREDFLRAAETGERASSIPCFVRNKNGKDGLLWRQCTRDYKINVVRRAIREYLGYGPRERVKETVELWMGISTDEIQRVKTSPIKWIKNVYPLIEKGMSRSDCIRWMKDHGYPEPPKSSCIGCPYHSDAYWLDMKLNDPESWQDAVDFDRRIRRLPRIEGEVFLHRSLKPLEEVDFYSQHEQMELDLFDNDCEGMCGI